MLQCVEFTSKYLIIQSVSEGVFLDRSSDTGASQDSQVFSWRSIQEAHSCRWYLCLTYLHQQAQLG